jgi:CheY-like chemotaxis protein
MEIWAWRAAAKGLSAAMDTILASECLHLIDRTNAPAATQRRKLKVLVVDSDTESLARTLHMLHSEGDWATGVGSAEGALIRFLEGAFDVLLTGVLLPGLPGTILAQKLHERADLPVIYIGGPGWAKPSTCAFVLRTPYSTHELQAALDWAAAYPRVARMRCA